MAAAQAKVYLAAYAGSTSNRDNRMLLRIPQSKKFVFLGMSLFPITLLSVRIYCIFRTFCGVTGSLKGELSVR